MIRVRPLRRDDAPAVLEFERAERRYFARAVGDRGDDYFDRFDERHEALMSEQDAGTARMHLVIDGDDAIIGRVNLVDVEEGRAELGYRIAERATGRGVATEAVRLVCALAVEYGLVELRAGTDADNVASQRVLTRNGFTPVDADDPAERRFVRRL